MVELLQPSQNISNDVVEHVLGAGDEQGTIYAEVLILQICTSKAKQTIWSAHCVSNNFANVDWRYLMAQGRQEWHKYVTHESEPKSLEEHEHTSDWWLMSASAITKNQKLAAGRSNTKLNLVEVWLFLVSSTSTPSTTSCFVTEDIPRCHHHPPQLIASELLRWIWPPSRNRKHMRQPIFHIWPCSRGQPKL